MMYRVYVIFRTKKMYSVNIEIAEKDINFWRVTGKGIPGNRIYQTIARTLGLETKEMRDTIEHILIEFTASSR